jgi:hypothetical protein
VRQKLGVDSARDIIFLAFLSYAVVANLGNLELDEMNSSSTKIVPDCILMVTLNLALRI